MLKKLLFTTILVIGCSLFAFGQQDDGKKPPPKENPPKIEPKPKETPKPTPKPNSEVVSLEAKAIVAE